MDKEVKTLIAVYGSLREGLHNHNLLSDATYIGTFTSSPSFTMYDLGQFPAIVNSGLFSIEFEVYAVNKKQAETVDSLEGYTGDNKTSWYKKGVIPTPYGKAFYYYFEKDENSLSKESLVESGNWKDHMTTKVN